MAAILISLYALVMDFHIRNISVNISKQGRRYVAYSPVLDIATSGSTEKIVKKRFEELLGIFLEELKEKGTINEVLAELGWKKVHRKWQPPVVSNFSIKMPSYA